MLYTVIVSSCGVKFQEVLSGLEKKAKTLDIHMHFCGFSLHSFFTLFFFLTTCGVIYIFFWLDRPFHSE